MAMRQSLEIMLGQLDKRDRAMLVLKECAGFLGGRDRGVHGSEREHREGQAFSRTAEDCGI